MIEKIAARDTLADKKVPWITKRKLVGRLAQEVLDGMDSPVKTPELSEIVLGSLTGGENKSIDVEEAARNGEHIKTLASAIYWSLIALAPYWSYAKKYSEDGDGPKGTWYWSRKYADDQKRRGKA